MADGSANGTTKPLRLSGDSPWPQLSDACSGDNPPVPLLIRLFFATHRITKATNVDTPAARLAAKRANGNWVVT